MSAFFKEKPRFELTKTLEGHSDYVHSVSLSPDGTKVASGSGDKTVKLWDVTSGECLQTLEGHSVFVNSVSFSPDGTKLASGSSDTTINIWEGPRVQERLREMTTMMLSLHRANCNERDRYGDPLPSAAGRQLYSSSDVGRHIASFL